VQSALAKIDGVSNAKVVYKSGKATVTVEKGKVTSEQLEQAVASIQGGRYKAKAQ
jgi:copper chaperone CopZ